MTQAPMPELLGLYELAQTYGVPKSTALSWTRRHGFPEPAYRMGAGTFWLKSDVDAWRAPEKVRPQRIEMICPTPGCDYDLSAEDEDDVASFWTCPNGHWSVLRVVYDTHQLRECVELVIVGRDGKK